MDNLYEFASQILKVIGEALDVEIQITFINDKDLPESVTFRKRAIEIGGVRKVINSEVGLNMDKIHNRDDVIDAIAKAMATLFISPDNFEVRERDWVARLWAINKEITQEV